MPVGAIGAVPGDVDAIIVDCAVTSGQRVTQGIGWGVARRPQAPGQAVAFAQADVVNIVTIIIAAAIGLKAEAQDNIVVVRVICVVLVGRQLSA